MYTYYLSQATVQGQEYVVLVTGTLFLIKDKETVIEENSGKSQFQPSCVPSV